MGRPRDVECDGMEGQGSGSCPTKVTIVSLCREVMDAMWLCINTLQVLGLLQMNGHVVSQHLLADCEALTL